MIYIRVTCNIKVSGACVSYSSRTRERPAGKPNQMSVGEGCAKQKNTSMRGVSVGTARSGLAMPPDIIVGQCVFE